VQRVANRIIAAAKQSRYADIAQQFHWGISVIKDDNTMNAFALPGGKVAVYTGLFLASTSIARSEPEGDLGVMPGLDTRRRRCDESSWP
jgi:predicted Zn-dependent protease